MAPPGRRKMNSIHLLPLLVLIIFATAANAASAALGIDFGAEYIKAAVARPGSPIEIVLTKDSKRKEAASLAFKPSRAQANDKDAYPERLYGGDALALSARYPADVYPNLKGLLGLAPTDPIVRSYTNRYPSLQIHEIPREDGSKSVGFSSKNLGKPDPFMVEELLAMELQNIKSNAETLVGKNNFVSDVVITYPAFYTAEEKRALELAADLAGFRLLGLISDGQAVGLNYATTRPFDAKKKDIQPEYHVVYDVGAGSTTATILKFHGKVIKGPGKKNSTVQEVQVLGYGYDRTLGGDSLNDLIVSDMIGKFLETKKIKSTGTDEKAVRADGKTMARLWKDAEKVRQVLSANQQASASFEGLFKDDVNFKYTITRNNFESLAQSHAQRISAPLQSALAMADLKLSDIESVILHGGLTRTPFVQAELERIVGSTKKIKTNINADEAAAFGAAFKSAGLSPSFRVKDIRTADISGSAYTMKWSVDGKEKNQKIFVETSQVGIEKQVPVKSADDMKIGFFQHVAGHDAPHPVAIVDATNLTKSYNELKTSYGCAASNITTVFNIRLSSFDGLPEIISGSVSCEAQKAKEGTVLDNVKGMLGFGGKKGDQKPLKEDEEDVLSGTPLPVDDPTSSGTVVDEATATASEKSASASAEVKPSTVVIPLQLKSTSTGPGAPPRKALPLIKQRLTAFDKSDQNAYQRSEALNVLEAFTYRARDYLDDENFAIFSTDKLRKELQAKLSETSEWLYGDGSDAKLQDFKDRLKAVQALVEPVLKRKEESSKREEAIDLLKNSLRNASSMMDMIKGIIKEAAEEAASTVNSVASSVIETATAGDDLEDEPYAPSSNTEATETPQPKQYRYTEEDFSSIEKVYETTQKWLEDSLKAQDKLKSYEDPAFLVADINAKARTVGAAVSDVVMKQIKMQQPPKQPKKPRSKKSKKPSATTSAAENTVEATVSATTTVKDEL